MDRTIEEIMQRDVVTVRSSMAVRELLKTLVSNQISGVPVVSEAGDIVGVVSTTDVVRLGSRESEFSRGTLHLGPLAVPNEDYDAESAAPFFMVPEEWSVPSEGRTDSVPDGIFDEFTVADIMTPAAFTVHPKESVRAVAKFLLKGRIHRALVVEESTILGIVTAFDLLKAFVEE